MTIRRALQKDIPALSELLRQVCDVHHQGRPDLFQLNGTKYTPEQLSELIEDDSRPIFVAETEEGVKGYAFCVFKQQINVHRRSLRGRAVQRAAHWTAAL